MATQSITEKQCFKCKTTKPIADFQRNRRVKDGFATYCRACAGQLKREGYARWTPEQRELHRDRVLRKRYGIGLEFVKQMYELQEGCCAICGKPGDRPAVEYFRGSQAGVLCIDHCHKTGKVRGLLCTNCNVGLGRFGEDPAMFLRAAQYVLEEGVI